MAGTVLGARLIHPDMLAIRNLLSSPLVSSLLLTHPNELAASGFLIPPEWASWWDWAADVQDDIDSPKWLSLVQAYNRRDDVPGQGPRSSTDINKSSISIPIDLQCLINEIRRLQLDRHPIHIPGTSGILDDHGMSPKKSHEVSRMKEYIARLLGLSPELGSVRHVVDIGAGQGYISGALMDQLGLHVLALDSSEAQTTGAERKAISRQKYQRRNKGSQTTDENTARIDPSRAAGEGSIVHKTIHITSNTLRTAIDDWILREAPNLHQGVDGAAQDGGKPIRVLFVALHACGSLTTDILRAFLSCHRSGASLLWTPSALVVVGCCYNLISPNDFPLSNALAKVCLRTSPPLLSLAHLQLAAQVPSQWLQSPESLSAAKLAIRKVVYRALLQPILQDTLRQQADRENSEYEKKERIKGTGETPENRRLGKLNDSAYADWDTFLSRAGAKMGLCWESQHISAEKQRQMKSRVEVLHVLRCLLGPLVESLIIQDRYTWLREELEPEPEDSNTGMDIEVVNLFDQRKGSGRNVAIVITPRS